jgi:hypothetical protein
MGEDDTKVLFLLGGDDYIQQHIENDEVQLPERYYVLRECCRVKSYLQ